ncbi:hypothetical protein HYQ46_010794 [Verticillium longisporum]|nr:hypothetical protein HYQ46_010794 [Verticillium longisporum]
MIVGLVRPVVLYSRLELVAVKLADVLSRPALVPALWRPRWLEFLFPVFFGSLGPISISSCQYGFVFHGDGWAYRPGCSISSVALFSRSFLAFCLALYRPFASLHGVQAR